jgi:putative IMPACT (imprinted ancient) family translation regulator
VRYFGGTKLGVPGLINAYRDSAAAVLEQSNIVEKTIDTIFKVGFPYINMNEVMRAVKEEQPRIISQNFDNSCTMTMAVRRSRAAILENKLRGVEGLSIEVQ